MRKARSRALRFWLKAAREAVAVGAAMEETVLMEPLVLRELAEHRGSYRGTTAALEVLALQAVLAVMVALAASVELRARLALAPRSPRVEQISPSQQRKLRLAYRASLEL